MDTAAVLGDALTDYVLATGTKRASATGAPEHMARWLEAHGYRIVPVQDSGRGDPDSSGRVDLIAAGTGGRCVGTDGADGTGPCWILREVLDATIPADAQRVA